MSKQAIPPVVVLAFVLIAAPGCKKKAPVAPPPPAPTAVKEVPPAPPPPKAPVISQFTAEPGTIERGQSSTLRWSVSDATSASVEPGIGTVQATGSRRTFPGVTTTYTLRAQGPGGHASAVVLVTVIAPPPPPPAPPPKKGLSERLSVEVQDAYFNFDKSDIREDARAALSQDSVALKAIFNDFPRAVIEIEGHCDERGSAEYNLGLGDRRANAAKEFLTQLGVPGERLKLISFGKERPQCTESNEECWQKNRRVHFSPEQ